MMASSTQASAAHKGEVLLNKWPNGGAQYYFIDMPHFLKDLASIATSLTDESRANGPWFLFTDVDESAWDTIQCSDNELKLNCTYVYDPENETVWLKMESLFHSTTAMAITRWIERKIREMDLGDSILFTGTTNYTLGLYDEFGDPRITEEGPAMIVRKRADQAIHPFTVRPHRTMEWSSLIIETAYSEPRSQISDDIRAWLLGSNGDIKFAMAAFIRGRTQKISIEQIELVNKPTKTISPRWVTESSQSITIEAPKKNGDPVIKGHFRVPFGSIFLREPKEGEADLVMETDDILQIARQVWRTKSIQEARIARKD